MSIRFETGPRVQESKGPRDPAGFKGRVTQGPRTLLATEQTIAAIQAAAAPVVVEPAPIQVPAVVAPEEARDALTAVRRVPPVREDDLNLAVESGGNLVPVGEEVDAVVLAEVGAHFPGAGDHRAAADGFLAILEEAADLVGAAGDGHLGQEEEGLDERLGEPLHRRGVVRAHESREQVPSDLALQVCG